MENYSTLMNIKISTYSIVGLFVAVFLYSCTNSDEKNNQKQLAVSSANIVESNNTPQPPSITSQSLELKTFEIKDTLSGKSLGWGYDIYVDGKRNIHQPILPGVAGNKHFSSEEHATITGTFAVNKMKQTGGLPTITIKELDSLGVTK